MAHNIEYNKDKGSYSFVTAKKKAWHNLGTVYDEELTTQEAIKGANLDFDVNKVPNYVNIDGKFVESGSFSTVRSDNNAILGSALGDRYTVLQNADAFGFIDQIVGESESVIETAGALGIGETVFITAKMPDHIQVKTDFIEQYLLITNNHSGWSAVTVMFTPVRVVCNNTLNMALRSRKNKVSFRHTSNVKESLIKAKHILGINDLYQQELKETLTYLSKKKMTQKQFDEFVFNLLLSKDEISKLNKLDKIEDAVSTRKRNIMSDLKTYYFNGVGQNTPDALGTRYGALNAVTGFFQNVKNWKSEDDKMYSIISGSAQKTANKAMALLTV